MEKIFLKALLEAKKQIMHKVFISYHKADFEAVKQFVKDFSEGEDIFITRALDMEQQIIDSTDTDYVMRRIRELYMSDSTVTIVMIGKCTWARRYIDWEIQASLRKGEKIIPNGLLGIKLPSYNKNGYTDRLNKNLKQNKEQEDCYARVIDYPFNARTTREHLIVNPREKFKYNKFCEN